MWNVKKTWREELVQLALLLSLLRTDTESRWGHPAPLVEVGAPAAWEHSLTSLRFNNYVNSKGVDSMLSNYERWILYDLNLLGRYSEAIVNQDYTAYVGLTNNDDTLPSTSGYPFDDEEEFSLSELGSPQPWNLEDPNFCDTDLTPEDKDLIEVLWKEDVDMGFSEVMLSAEAASLTSDDEDASKPPSPAQVAVKEEKSDYELWSEISLNLDIKKEDLEVKEERLTPELDGGFAELEHSPLSGGSRDQVGDAVRGGPTRDRQLHLLQAMLAAPSHLHTSFQGHNQVGGGGLQSRQGRSSTDQRWQDLSGFFEQDPPTHYHLPYAASRPYASGGCGSCSSDTPLQQPLGLMTNASQPMGAQPGPAACKLDSPHNMLYYQNGSDPGPSPDSGFMASFLSDEDLLMDMPLSNHQPTSSAPPHHHSAEGVYTSNTKALEGCGGAADSDSAVSSMGSDRVPSLASDTDWMETNSDSGQTPADHFMASLELYSKSNRWYDYSYCRSHSGENGAGKVPAPVAQKKYQLYGKRFSHDNPPSGGLNSSMGTGGGMVCSTMGGAQRPLKFEYPVVPDTPGPSAYQPDSPARLQEDVKFSTSVEFQTRNSPYYRPSPSDLVAHNHSYHLPTDHYGMLQRTVVRDKRGGSRWNENDSLFEGCQSRDERRARALAIPISVDDIINLPMDEYNDRLSKFDLTESQLSLIRDIRRRGKNKVAAQNCRKRKLDQIMTLAEEVKAVRDRKLSLRPEREALLQERHRITNRVSLLYRHIFKSLRDSDGRPYSVQEWTLQETSAGSLSVVRRQENLESSRTNTTCHSSQSDPS